jgi:hypothetical protein
MSGSRRVLTPAAIVAAPFRRRDALQLLARGDAEEGPERLEGAEMGDKKGDQ